MKKPASKSRRPLKIALGVLIALVVLLLAVEFAIDSMIRSSFRLAVPAFLGVKEASVETLDFSFFKKHTLLLENLHIGNPEGYKTDGLFDLAKVDVKIKLSSLFSSAIEIEHVWIDGVEVTYEKGLTSSNLADLLARFESGDSPEPAPDAPKKEKSASKPVVIRDLNIEGTRLHPTITLAQGFAPSIPLPPIHLTDIGAPAKEGDPAGITLAGALRLVLQALLSSVTGTAGATVDLAVDGVKAVGSGIAAAASFINPFSSSDNSEAEPAPEAEAEAPTSEPAPEDAANALQSAAETAADAVSAVSGKAVEGAKAIGEGLSAAAGFLNPFSSSDSDSPDAPVPGE